MALRSWTGLALIVALGCGPTLGDLPDVANEDGSTTSEAEGESGSNHRPADPSDPQPGSDGSSSGDTGGTTGEPDADTGDSDDSSDGEDPYACGCEDTVEIGADDPIEGHTASSIVAALTTPNIAWEWLEFEDSPTQTTLHFSVVLGDGPVLHGPGGSDGCNFLSSPCDNALLVPVAVTLTTDDGIIAGTIDGTLDVDLDDYEMVVALDAEATPADLGGTFAERAVPGVEGEVTGIALRMGWSLDGEWTDAFLGGDAADGWTLLGRAL